VTTPSHAVQLTDSLFIVSHRGPVAGVSLLDEQGRVAITLRNSASMHWFKEPLEITVSRHGYVLVDHRKNRIVFLNSSLSRARALNLPIDGELNRPQCFYYDELFGRLYIGEHAGDRRILVFENINTCLIRSDKTWPTAAR